MRRMWAICSKELQLYFLNPTTYFAIAVYVLLSSYMFYVSFVGYQPSILDYRLILGNTIFMLLIIIPLLTMRLISEEFRQGTDELLLTSPVTVTEIVIGKYLASLGLLLVLIACNLVYPITMSFFGTMNIPMLLLSLLAVFLLGAAMMAIGLFASSLSQHQMVSAVIAFVLLLGLWIIDSFTMNSDIAQKWLEPFSISSRIDNLVKGVLHGPDILFYLTLSLLFLVLSIQVVERKRWR
ncbi:ABC-2 type transport system permease protein [Paenibacillus sp. SORGH_AS306]|uniref:ABC transporter permease subunit n=1 Tax=Paenibacillus kyungheensis TaxID=1452732 RepID=A0AAX3M0R7_9BACL|nr:MULTISPECIES: ABC transporter permease subunit [Paenibacillus]MDQ1235438.1 ABC-2 type transport system permease protein [Paenibacillus sp. SORGH_AS_0306]MDR6112487.1 ABC-2 type transport system permease protein [Paenibacillus sp. SORGH_AS_0338]WCT54973.1 ABC transporter permease subunit [Paenibacillus kyungheensis]WDF51883.1 ABC transporter permease subunit [Paenibacillus sp. KACC 21273]